MFNRKEIRQLEYRIDNLEKYKLDRLISACDEVTRKLNLLFHHLELGIQHVPEKTEIFKVKR